MNELIFPALTAADVECRVNLAKPDKGLSLLLYKDARCDMRVLDKVVGSPHWQKDFYTCKESLFCKVGIHLEGWPEWIWKSDCGTESNAEAQKGEASDAFKRACFNWGIGRELYTAPFIWIPLSNIQGEPNYKCDDRGRPLDRFVVTYMRVEDGAIAALNIENARTHRTVYVFGDVLPEYVCEVCGKALTKDFAAKSQAANGGRLYCSGACKRKAQEASNG